MATLSEDQIAERLSATEWERDGDMIGRDFKFADFREAMAFVNEVAAVAEEMNHHPDILVHGWNRVRLTATTHSAGGLTENDFELAGRVDGFV
jgi:4a-hydroxytetrahydrobiopterin dehydratase